jgi:hypothetical protein
MYGIVTQGDHYARHCAGRGAQQVSWQGGARERHACLGSGASCVLCIEPSSLPSEMSQQQMHNRGSLQCWHLPAASRSAVECRP